VDEGTWTFSRGADRLTLQRQPTDAGYALSVASGGGLRSYSFAELAALVRFQCDMETFLLTTGWTFEAFAPERRKGGDRRRWPRPGTDRRRWWTDGRR
jgi:hypothetical protein